ncbi:alkaline phosphatase D family protein [uncultured Rubinisphaera sp.]|uniref:alkaline phosphatase D family protein n=1 Tax=uncultured Rubinisphaera sp. TaxID=1678686 RepID=UPI0030D87B0E
MMLRYIFIAMTAVVFLSNSLSGKEPQADFVFPQRLNRITCGSCSKQDLPQPIWQAIIASEPDLFIYMGDNIYGDSEDLNVLAAKWEKQKSQPGYTALREQCSVIGTWDDHDYGKNDAGIEYPQKAGSQQLFLDFLDEPDNSLRRTREGVYASYLYGPVGQQVHIILLDTRYFRTPLKKIMDQSPTAEGHAGPYGPTDDPNADMLGEAQWEWLEEQLRVPAELRLIVSSIQVLPLEQRYEKWENLPTERARLLKLIEKTNSEGVVFLSGDRHAAEFSKLNREGSYPLLEMTSSSLNAPRKYQNELNSFRFGLMYNEVNFGKILIDWKAETPSAVFSVCDIEGREMLQVPVAIPSLHHVTD